MKKFSLIASKVSVSNNALEIQQRRLLTISFILAFITSLIIFVIKETLPTLIIISICLGIGILLWALIDVLRSKAEIKYFFNSKLVQVKAIKGGFKYTYNGDSQDHIFLEKIQRSKNTKELLRYSIILRFKDSDIDIPFQLSNFQLSETSSDHLLEEWKQKLKL